MEHKKSKFVWDAHTMSLVEGRAPSREGPLFKGEDTKGNLMELAYCDTGDGTCPYVCYWGWS